MSLYSELLSALNSAKKERDISPFLKEHLSLLRCLNEHSWNCVFLKAELSLGNKYRADFVILSACSAFWNCVLIEMQSPTDPIYTKLGEESKGLREARRQITEWELFIKLHDLELRQDLSELAVDCAPKCSIAGKYGSAREEILSTDTIIRYTYKVLIGRNTSLSPDDNWSRENNSDFEIVTFDRILEYAKRLSE